MGESKHSAIAASVEYDKRAMDTKGDTRGHATQAGDEGVVARGALVETEKDESKMKKTHGWLPDRRCWCPLPGRGRTDWGSAYVSETAVGVPGAQSVQARAKHVGGWDTGT